ncbi:MAG: M23 family metallopeptidase [Rhodospirillaceae bacterium]|nr:M23 family metallopeptidase [Rhodospirillaceae bacterium]
MKRLLFALALLLLPGCARADAIRIDGNLTQGGLVIGQVAPGSSVLFEGRHVRVGAGGWFLLGFGREAPPQALVEATLPDGTAERLALDVAQREYDIQHIDGLPDQMVTPDEALQVRIAAERETIIAAWAHDTTATDFLGGFVWPVIGPISGVYGSQRILNGEPRQPHFGVDMAAPEGTPVAAPAGGIVRLAEPDLYFTGGTVIIDHGHGLSSTLMHMASVAAVVGQRVEQGDIVGTVGATGRATGPHLDWRMNLYEARIDPQLLVPPMVDSATTP